MMTLCDDYHILLGTPYHKVRSLAYLACRRCLLCIQMLQAFEDNRGIDAAKGKVVGDNEISVDIAFLPYNVI